MSENQSAPIILVHGIFGFNQLTFGGLKVADYFRSVAEALRRDGHVVPEPPQLNPGGSVAERAQDLKKYLQDPNRGDVFDKRVNIIAHSMGGLDSRFMISKLEMANRVHSLTTIGTPHHGSPIADLIVNDVDAALSEFMEHLGVDVQGLLDLTTDACRRFNEQVADANGIHYFSIAGQYTPSRTAGIAHGLLGPTHDIIAKTEFNNDGLVSITSATMGRPAWTALDAWEANHFRLVNWGANIFPSLLELGDTSIIEKYRNLAQRIAAIA
jgi:triacylglycerol lipase